ncbi:uncharacterized protein GJ701_000075 [Geothlypis trichas]
MTQTYQKAQKCKKQPGTLKHLTTSTKPLRSPTLSIVQCRRSSTDGYSLGLRFVLIAQRAAGPGDSQAEMPVPHTSRADVAPRGAAPARCFPGEAGRGQLSPAERRECRAGSGCPLSPPRRGTGRARHRQRHTEDAAPSAAPAPHPPRLWAAPSQPARPLCRESRDTSGKNAAAHRVFRGGWSSGAVRRPGEGSVWSLRRLR